MRFLVDAQFPPTLARWLSDAGHPSTHVADCGLLDATDSRIWQFALDSARIVVSKDDDFARRRNLVPDGPTIVWVRKGNIRNAELLAWFGEILPTLTKALARGEGVVELY